MTKLWMGAGLAVLDVVSVGCVVEQASWNVVAATIVAATITVLPWANELAERLFRGDET